MGSMIIIDRSSTNFGPSMKTKTVFHVESLTAWKTFHFLYNNVDLSRVFYTSNY